MCVKSKAGRFSLFGAIVLTGAALLAGCGGSNDSDSVSKEDFIAQANAICAEFTKQSDQAKAEFDEAFNSGDTEKAGDLFQQQSDRMSAAVDEMATLEKPADDKDTLDEFVDLSRQQADTMGQVADALRSGDESTLNDLVAEAEETENRSDEIADSYGLTECGSENDGGSSEG